MRRLLLLASLALAACSPPDDSVDPDAVARIGPGGTGAWERFNAIAVVQGDSVGVAGVFLEADEHLDCRNQGCVRKVDCADLLGDAPPLDLSLDDPAFGDPVGAELERDGVPRRFAFHCSGIESPAWGADAVAGCTAVYSGASPRGSTFSWSASEVLDGGVAIDGDRVSASVRFFGTNRELMNGGDVDERWEGEAVVDIDAPLCR